MSTVFSSQKESRTASEVVQEFPRLVLTESLSNEDTVIYGTSDPTINPAEVWMTSLMSEGAGAWEFFNYPLGAEWIEYDVNNLFAPYPFPEANDPFSVVSELGLEKKVVDKLSLHNIQDILSFDDPLCSWTLEEAVRMIKEYRKNRSFVVVNFISNDRFRRVYGSKKDKKFYRDKYSQWTLGELLSDRTIKLGGALIYFIFGYCSARRKSTILFPNNVLGDVWGAVAAGADVANNGDVKLFPIGSLDIMTTKQWDCWYRNGIWKKAPVRVIRRLQNHPFRKTLLHFLLEKKTYCPIAYDENGDEFYFVELEI